MTLSRVLGLQGNVTMGPSFELVSARPLICREIYKELKEF